MDQINHRPARDVEITYHVCIANAVQTVSKNLSRVQSYNKAMLQHKYLTISLPPGFKVFELMHSFVKSKLPTNCFILVGSFGNIR